jgi:hypothetical protein
MLHVAPLCCTAAAQGELKIADFGWSVHAPSSRRKTLCGQWRRHIRFSLALTAAVSCELTQSSASALLSSTGTVDYLAPEMVANEAHDEKVLLLLCTRHLSCARTNTDTH